MAAPNAENDALILEALANGRLSADTEAGNIFGVRGKPIGYRLPSGYRGVAITTKRHVLVHRVIWAAHHGTIDSELEINHRNTIRHDNRIRNLEQVTQAENVAHAFGTYGYKGIRDKDLATLAADRPEWLAQVMALKASGKDVTTEDLIDLRDSYEGRHWMSQNRDVRVTI